MKGQSKITLLMELKNKLFLKGLKTSEKSTVKTIDKLKSKFREMKMGATESFNALKDELPVVGRAVELMTNKFVLGAAAVVGIGMALSSASSKAAEFGHEFLQIQNLNLDKTQTQLDNYQQSIKDTAFAVGSDLTQTTRAFYDVQSATGFFGKEVASVVKEVGNFSVATGADLNDSINATTKAIKAFNLSAEDTKMLLESNAKTVQVGITTFSELAKVQTEYAGAAAGVGASVNTANKIFAAFTSIAKDSATAATLTKTAFQGLTQKQTVKGLEDIGIEMYDVNGQMRNLDSVLKEVSNQFKTMSPKAIDETINKIGGPEGLRALFVKLKTGSADFFNTLEAFDSSKFDLDKALKNAQGDFKTLSSIVKNRFNVLMTSLGQKILPLVATVVEGVNRGLVWFNENLDNIQDVFETLVIVTGSYLTYLGLLKVGSIAAAIASGGLTGALAMVRIGINAVSTAIFNIPLIGWILAAITALVVMYKKWDKFREVVDGVWESIKALATIVKDGFIGAIKSAWTVVKSFFSNMWTGVKNFVSGLIDGLVGIGKIIKSAITFDWDGVKKGAKETGEAFKKAGGGILDAIPITNVIKNYKEYGKKGAESFNKSYNENAKGRLGVADAYNHGAIQSLYKTKGLLNEDGSHNKQLFSKLKIWDNKGNIDNEKVRQLKKDDVLKIKAELDTKSITPISATANSIVESRQSDNTTTGGSFTSSTEGSNLSAMASGGTGKSIVFNMDAFFKGDIKASDTVFHGKDEQEIRDIMTDAIAQAVNTAETT